MRFLIIISFGLALSFFYTSCENSNAAEVSPALKLESSSASSIAKGTQHGTLFDHYWYQGKAEITTYNLTQARYGDYHDGKAVLIFVTEDFSKSKLHKLNSSSQNPDDAIKILKLNMTKDFNTGIYPYSTMNSVFTPVDLSNYTKTLKVTMTAQEWCGHSFVQVNNKQDGYSVSSFSYFDNEGEEEINIDDVFLEDELWTRIRIDPASLPQGNFKALPSTLMIRLKHLDIGAVDAKANLKTEGDYSTYTIEFPSLKRSLAVKYQTDFPRQIMSWEETYVSGWGNQAKTLTTKASLDQTSMLDYWNYNSPNDEQLRKELGLE